MMTKTTINDRLNILCDTYEKGRKASFARTAGISNQGVQELLAGRKGGPSFGVLTSIVDAYPQVRLEWLIKGEEPMLHTEQPEAAIAADPKAVEVIVRETLRQVGASLLSKLL
jgi:hypothetical protein